MLTAGPSAVGLPWRWGAGGIRSSGGGTFPQPRSLPGALLETQLLLLGAIMAAVSEANQLQILLVHQLPLPKPASGMRCDNDLFRAPLDTVVWIPWRHVCATCAGHEVNSCGSAERQPCHGQRVLRCNGWPERAGYQAQKCACNHLHIPVLSPRCLNSFAPAVSLVVSMTSAAAVPLMSYWRSMLEAHLTSG